MSAVHARQTMDSYPRPRRWLALRALAVGLLSVAVAACDDDGPAAPGASLTVTPTTVDLTTGETQTLEASLDGTATTAVSWESADSGVASVDAGGVVTGVAIGVTSITATSTASPSAQADVAVTVVGCQDPTPIDSDVSSPAVWTAQGHDCTDYVVMNPIDVTDQLQIEAGTIVLFEEDAGLRIRSSSGSLEVSGTAAEQVRFAGTDPTPGWWRGIEMWRTGTENPSSLDHAIIEDAGRPVNGGAGYSLQLGTPGTTDVSDVNVIHITNTVIRDGGGYGLRATRFSEVPSFSDNTVTGHPEAPVWVSARNSGFLDEGSDLTGNGEDFVRVEGDEEIGPTGQINAITEAITWARLASDVPYRFDGVAQVTAELTVAPGVTVEFEEDGELRVTDGGSLLAQGTAAAPITFTGSEAVRGHWRGVVIWRPGEDPESVFDHVTIEYGGRAATDFPEEVYGFNLAIGSPASDPSSFALNTTLTNTTLRESAGYGLFISHASTFVEDGFANNTLTANAEGAARVSAQSVRWLDTGTSYGGNDDEHLLIDARDSPWDNVVSDATWITLGDDVRYVVAGVIDLRAVLTLEPGIVLSFRENTGLFSHEGEASGLVAEGTATDRIVLTGETQVAGSWYGVYLRSARSAGNIMDYVTIEYGGGEFDGGVVGWVSNQEFNLSVGQIPSNTAQMLITNSEFRDAGVQDSGRGYGLYVGEDSLVNDDACGANLFINTQQGCLLVE